MLQYPHINPVALQLGPFHVYWYGLMYLLSFIIGWSLANYRAKHSEGRWNKEQVSDLIFFVAFGAVIGGRFGYMLFYNFYSFIHAPWIFFKIWEGGMSFHGGFLGVLLMMCWFARKYHKSFFDVTDFIAPIIPIGLAAGRIGNFINAYIWGRVTSLPWGMIYPYAGSQPRHPIALYESLFEGVFLFIILWFYSANPRPRMAVSAMFLVCYGCFRCFLELFRQPDSQLGFIAFGWLTMGQLLSFPMIILGVILFWITLKRNKLWNNT